MSAVLLKTPIVCLAGEDWWYHPARSRRQLMTRLSEDRRVLFVNSVGSGLPSAASAGGFAGRVLRKMRSWGRGLTQAAPNLFVLSPVALPGAGQGLLRDLSGRLLAAQIRVAMRSCAIDRPILWVGLPSFAPVLGGLGEQLVVFHASDRFDVYGGAVNESVAKAQAACIRKADLIVAVSEPLATLAREINPAARVETLTHGVDAELFAQARRPGFAEHPKLALIPRPRLGYLGSVEQFQDAELLATIARTRPEWQLVFVGPNSADLAELRKYPNAHFLPQCPPGDAPAYLAGFDLCMIPRRMDAWVSHSNPLKFKEYLAAGREVVTSDIPALRPWGRYAWLAPDREAFIEACEAVLTRKETRVPLLDMRLMDEESWETKSRQAASFLAEALQRKTRAETE